MDDPLALRIPIADSYYFIATDRRLGRGRTSPRVLGIGLAASLLAELWIVGTIEVGDGKIYVVHLEPPADPLLHNIAAYLISQRHHQDLATWMAYLAVTAEAKVADRLKMARLLKEVEQRRLVGKRKLLVPADGNEAAWQSVRMERLLNTHSRMYQVDCFLAGIVSVTGLMPHVLWDPETNDAGFSYLHRVFAGTHSSLMAIIRQAEAAVGQAVLAPR
jgi:hypothetical protein